MDLFNRSAQALLNEALSEIQSLRSELELERSKRVSADALADSYRLQAERSNELARKFEDERSQLMKDRLAEKDALIQKLVSNATPRDNPGELAHVKEELKAMPRAGVNPLRKMLIDSDRALLSQQIERSRARTGVPAIDKALDHANALHNAEIPPDGKPN
jgi:hypothetical protein